MKTVTIEDCEKLLDDFHEYTNGAEQHEFAMLAMIDAELQLTLERYREAGEVTNQQDARAMFRVVSRVIGKDYSEYKEAKNEDQNNDHNHGN